ncbi:putative pentatricopeptide [Rosa chinensis]|uniref:Putative pentatricopeptide n=1 Tax=Rosa chinensis TaxID=74649 RepID=A0A2P6PG45_ROSCH|nr:putative pentatricopeptide [Rosa chinensis]
MISMGMHPDEFTNTTLINAYCKEGDLNKALHLNDEMIKKGFLPDVVTYSVLINGLNKRARTREAKKLLLKLFYDNSAPDDVTYNTLIESCTNVEFKSVVALVKGFCMKGLMKEADQVFEQEGNVQKALNLYKEMLLSGFLPHTVTVIVLIKELFTEGMNNELSQVIENTLRSCELTDAELAKLLVETNHKEGNMDAVFNVLSEMAKDGLLPNSGASACAGG